MYIHLQTDLSISTDKISTGHVGLKGVIYYNGFNNNTIYPTISEAVNAQFIILVIVFLRLDQQAYISFPLPLFLDWNL